MPIRTFQHEEPRVVVDRQDEPVRCRFCGGEGTIEALYTETVYGTAYVQNRFGDLDDYERGDLDNFDIYKYACTECNTERDDLEDLILGEDEEYEGNPDQLEPMEDN